MSRRTDAKLQALREARALNARPQRVADPLFGEREFFDPRDLVQVKYEMLRRVLTEKRPVTEAATAFGFSRVAFYQTQAAFAEHGLPGLLAKRPGPRGRTNSRQPWWNTSSSNTPRTRACAEASGRDGPREVRPDGASPQHRARPGQEAKKRAIDFDRESPSPRPSPEVDWAARYEVLRQQTLDCGQAAAGWGLALLIHRGVAAWMNACSATTAELPQAQSTVGVAASSSSESIRRSPAVLPGVAPGRSRFSPDDFPNPTGSLTMNDGQKVHSEHLKRDAYLYVRQSTLHQVVENTESTERQYALRARAIQLGWPAERVITIDQDQAQSAATAGDREGFQKLVTAVSMGRVGIVLGLEVSRLARNSSDWHRLLEICRLAGTLILDEDGLYDPSHFNDRLLLGLKGTMSEAELHVLRTRLQGGIESKARRGELKTRLPTGLVYDDHDRVVFDPDRQVQHALATFFERLPPPGHGLRGCEAFP